VSGRRAEGRVGVAGTRDGTAFRRFVGVVLGTEVFSETGAGVVQRRQQSGLCRFGRARRTIGLDGNADSGAVRAVGFLALRDAEAVLTGWRVGHGNKRATRGEAQSQSDLVANVVALDGVGLAVQVEHDEHLFGVHFAGAIGLAITRGTRGDRTAGRHTGMRRSAGGSWGIATKTAGATARGGTVARIAAHFMLAGIAIGSFGARLRTQTRTDVARSDHTQATARRDTDTIETGLTARANFRIVVTVFGDAHTGHALLRSRTQTGIHHTGNGLGFARARIRIALTIETRNRRAGADANTFDTSLTRRATNRHT